MPATSSKPCFRSKLESFQQHKHFNTFKTGQSSTLQQLVTYIHNYSASATEYPENEEINYKASICRSLFPCCKPECDKVGFVNRLEKTRFVELNGTKQRLKNIRHNQVYCKECVSVAPRDLEVLTLDDVRSNKGATFELHTEIKICECRQCEKFYLRETEQHELISLNKHGEGGGNVNGHNRTRCPCPACNPPPNAQRQMSWAETADSGNKDRITRQDDQDLVKITVTQ